MTTSGNIWGTYIISSVTDIDWNTSYAQQIRNMPPAAPPAIKHLKQDHSPNCCGCDFMSWFPQPDGNGFIQPKVIDQVREQLVEHKARYNSMMLVILNNLQRPFYEKMLLDEGYKVIMDKVYHPGHGHNLYLYGYEKYDSNTLALR